MNNILFFYNIILTVFFTIVLTGFCIMYMKNRKREFLFLGLLYLLLIIDNSIVYISEFSKSFQLFYENTDMVYVFIYLTYLGIVLTTRFIMVERFNDPFTMMERWSCIVLPIVLAILCLFASYEISEGLIHISFFGALSYIAVRTYRHIKKSDMFDEKRTKRYSQFIWIIIFLCFLALIESSIYYITFFNSTDLTTDILEYRNFVFDIIKLVIGAIGVKHLYSSFEELFDKKSIDEHLNEFCIKHSLTNRQKEIIQLIIDGYTNKEIGDKLNITEGTVKVHISNIFKKTDVTNRSQIVKKILHS